MNSTHFYVIVLSVVCLASVAMAESPYEQAWAVQFGTAAYDHSFSVAVDGSGNTYISTSTDSSLGEFSGSWETSLTKFDPLGNVLWSQQIGTTYDEQCPVAVDGSGNAYISGSTAGVTDAFLTKFDPSGNMLWSQQIGTPSYDYSRSVALDGSGNAYISGWTSGDLGGVNTGSSDAFLTKFDSSGSVLWSHQIGTWESDHAHSVSVDVSGNVYISGDTQGDLGGNNAGYHDVFLTKLDASGNELWSRQFGTSREDWNYSVAVDDSGNTYITGLTLGDLEGTNAGSLDAYLAKFDAAGNELWRRQFGTAVNDYGYSVALDDLGNAYITGMTGGELGGASVGMSDVFLAKFDPSGNEMWLSQIGTTANDTGLCVALDASGNAYISGRTAGDLGGDNAGYWDAFLVKYEPVPEPATMGFLVLGGVALLRRNK